MINMTTAAFIVTIPFPVWMGIIGGLTMILLEGIVLLIKHLFINRK